MTRKTATKHRQPAQSSPQSALRKNGARLWIVAAVSAMALIGILAVTWSVNRQHPTSPLVGRWVRPDGGYVLEIRSVNKSGKLDATYSNPSAIHVAKAQATEESGAMKVFVELQDVNYPGSTYTLTYDPKADQLNGSYYQAVAKETYAIFFERMK